MKKTRGFTLIEIFITFTLLIVLLSLYSFTNITTYIQKTKDAEAKNDLRKTRLVLESFYKDHGRYPTAGEMTYEFMIDYALAGKVCGSRYTDESLKQYVDELPCKANSPTEDYVYFPFHDNQDFILLTQLQRVDDPAINDSGCSGGCSYYTNPDDPINSISSNYFNYAVYTTLDYNNCSINDQWYCQQGETGLCNTCSGRTSGPCFDPVIRKYCQVSWCQVYCN